MKRILILAYDFPPYVSVGALRPYAWYKYLKEYGIYPIVVTRQWGNTYGDERDYIAPGESRDTIIEETEYGTIIRTPYKPNMANRLMLKYGKSRYALLRKAISAYYEFVQYMWNVGPKSCIFHGAKQYLKHYKVDAIIATGEPFVLFKYASALSKMLNIPWIADYRDPWTQNKNRSKNKLIKKWNAYFEKKYLSNAICAITVGDSYKEQVSSLISIPIHIITNGYDIESIENVRTIEQYSDCMRIAFVGRIYKWHPYESVLSCITQFVTKHKDAKIELNFYGINNRVEIENLIKNKYPILIKYVNIYGKMPNDTLMEHLAKHNVMLLFNYYNFMGTKIYDYIGIKRQILLCYSNDEEAMALRNKYYPSSLDKEDIRLQEKLLETTNSGLVIENKLHLLQTLEYMYSKFSQYGYIACNSHDIEQYSRKEQTGKLAEIINNISHEC